MYLLKSINDSTEVSEETWILHEMVCNTNSMFEATQEQLQRKEKDPLCINRLQEAMNREEQINLFIQFIQELEAFQKRFQKVQSESIAILDTINQLKAQLSDMQDPLPGTSFGFVPL